MFCTMLLQYTRPWLRAPYTRLRYPRTTICALPPEILSRIFLDLVQAELQNGPSLRVAFSLASVCRSWYDIALDTPLLWRIEIDFSDQPPFKQTEDKLHFAKRLPLSVKLNCRRIVTEHKIVKDRTLEMLEPHVPQIEHLYLSTQSTVVFQLVADLLFDPERPPPLKDLKIVISRFYPSPSLVSQLWSGIYTQKNLKRIFLNGLYSPQPFRLSALVDLHLDLAGCGRVQSDVPLEQILMDHPQLRSLVLRSVSIVMGPPGTIDASYSFQFDTLQRFSIGLMPLPNISSLLSRFTTPILKEFHIARPLPCLDECYTQLVEDIREFLIRQRSGHPEKRSSITALGFAHDEFDIKDISRILDPVPDLDTLFVFSRATSSVLEALKPSDSLKATDRPLCAHLQRLVFERCSKLDQQELEDFLRRRIELRKDGRSGTVDQVVVKYCGRRQPGRLKVEGIDVVWEELRKLDEEEVYWPQYRQAPWLTSFV